MATTDLDSYFADTGFRSRNLLFSESETYKKEKEKHHKKITNRKHHYFTSVNFTFDKDKLSCMCPAEQPMWCSSQQSKVNGKLYYRFEGYLNNCKT